MKECPRPMTVKVVQQFLGKVNYYHKFIPNATKILHPLYNLLKKNQKFIGTKECEEAFNKIKTYLAEQQILKIYDPKNLCYLLTAKSG